MDCQKEMHEQHKDKLHGERYAQRNTPEGWMHILICITICENMGHYEVVRVHYFVRGGFVGHRSRVSSKHLSLIFRSTGFDSSGVKKGLRCSCKMHVWVSGPPKTPTAVGVRSSDVTPAIMFETFTYFFC
ncbi:hypothetical protein TNCV_4925621 [Trichonephila clavipes]|nr:hypothetical protein TNCV_4925621 [Trichonephila clavipes]